MYSNNISVTFQQTKKGESFTYELDPLRTNSVPAPYQLRMMAWVKKQV